MIETIVTVSLVVGAVGVVWWLVCVHLLCAAIEQDRDADDYQPRD